jgi:hypothetical protein
MNSREDKTYTLNCSECKKFHNEDMIQFLNMNQKMIREEFLTSQEFSERLQIVEKEQKLIKWVLAGVIFFLAISFLIIL